MSSVHRYRVFCETEQTNIYTWNTISPTVCPNNNTHTINLNSIVIVDNVNSLQTEITNLNFDNTQTLQVIQKNVIISLMPYMGIPLLRNNVTTTGSGNISNDPVTESEINMNCSGADDSCILCSIDRGVYIAGLTCEVGIAIRIPNSLTGNQVLKWGYFSDQDGFYFKLTSTDFQVCIMNNSNEICISQSNFNHDNLDGSGISGNNIDFSKGNIFRILFSWYGYGLVSFEMVGLSKNNQQSNLIMHQYQTINTTSTRLPNLPIQVTFSNNGTVANTSVFVAGRSFSILGNYTDNVREVSAFKYLASISNEVFLPIFSIKRKEQFVGCSIKLINLYIKSSVDCEVQIISGSTLTSTIWEENTHHSESIAEIDKTSNTSTGGLIIYSTVVFSNEIQTDCFEDTSIKLNEIKPITIIAKSLTGESGNITVKIRYKEFW
jgi:hypothetical protein